MGISSKFKSYPFFRGGISSSGLQMPLTIGLGGQTYTVDLREYSVASQETLKPSYSTAADTNEALFNANGAWARYRYSWYHGSDQEFADLRDDADPFRFLASASVDVWEDHSVTLHRVSTGIWTLDTADIDPLATMISSGIYLFFTSPSELRRTSDLSSFDLINTGASYVNALATDGTDLFVAWNNGLSKLVGSATTTTAFATPVTGECHSVGFVGNRLLVSKANVLHEVAATGVLTTIYTHHQAAFRWTTIFAIGSKIYVGGFAGIRSELYGITVSSTGTLVIGAEAAPFPPNEKLRGAVPYGGAVLLLTSNGIRFAQVGGDGTLTYGPLIDGAGDVYAAAADGRFAYFGWNNYPDDAGLHSGLGRMALDVNVAPLQPAYAADISNRVVAGGTIQGLVTGVARHQGQTCWLIAGNVAYAGLSFTDYEATGFIDSGVITFGTVEPKILTTMQAVHLPLAAGESITATVYDENGDALASGTNVTVGSTELSFDVGAAAVNECSVRVTLNAGTGGSTTPTLKKWRLRAYPVPPPVDQWVVPIILHSRVIVNEGAGQEMTMVTFDEAERIKAWQHTKEAITYREGTAAYRVRVDAYEMKPTNWNDAGDFFEATMVVRLVSA